MKFLMIAGLTVVFVSVFFMLFIFDRVAGITADCKRESAGGAAVCRVSVSPQITISIMLASAFAVISIAVSYIMISTVTSKRAVCFGNMLQRKC